MINFKVKDIIPIKDYVDASMDKLKYQIEKNGIKPKLTIFQVGDRKDSNSYVKYKMKDAKKLGINANLIKLPSDIISNNEFKEKLINECSSDTDGIIVQLPLPSNIEFENINLIPRNKDIDGFRVDSLFYPCTPKGVIDWLMYNNIKLEDAHVAVIGRGICAGRPMVDMLIHNKSATVTCCHSFTSRDNMIDLCRHADIVISCVGKQNLITEDMVSDNTICIDVGRGDFSFGTNKKRNIYVSPKIGGTGLLTRLALMQNVVSSSNGICE